MPKKSTAHWYQWAVEAMITYLVNVAQKLFSQPKNTPNTLKPYL
jgi:hypothetical protein